MEQNNSGWLHDPSVILSSSVHYEVIYLGSVNARGSGECRDAHRALSGKFRHLHLLDSSFSFSFIIQNLSVVKGIAHHSVLTAVNFPYQPLIPNFSRPRFTRSGFNSFFSFSSFLLSLSPATQSQSKATHAYVSRKRTGAFAIILLSRTRATRSIGHLVSVSTWPITSGAARPSSSINSTRPISPNWSPASRNWNWRIKNLSDERSKAPRSVMPS